MDNSDMSLRVWTCLNRDSMNEMFRNWSVCQRRINSGTSDIESSISLECGDTDVKFWMHGSFEQNRKKSQKSGLK
jgi:hypothetical protein